jgi:D-glycero-alpha-D-manno-heptose-7-phosphate kinase
MSPAAAVVASAPTRIDLAGGTLDIWPLSVLVPRAVTVNAAIHLRSRVTIEPRPGGFLRLLSRDRACSVTRRLPLDPAAAQGPLSFLLRLVAAFAPRRGLRMVCDAAAPAGAGLGGSSTLGMAAAAALNRFTSAGLGSEALLRRVMNLETAELGVPTGNQDYLAALHGGLAAYHHEPDGTRREALAVPSGMGERLVLAYTGQPRHSGYSNWEMFRRFVNGEGVTVRRMEQIARVSRELAEALRAGALDEAGRLVGEEGRLRYRLAPSVATEALLRADRAARRAGALGVKVCGAGGGGCLVAFSAEGRAGNVAEALRREGATVLPARIAPRGLHVGTAVAACRGKPTS